MKLETTLSKTKVKNLVRRGKAEYTGHFFNSKAYVRYKGYDYKRENWRTYKLMGKTR